MKYCLALLFILWIESLSAQNVGNSSIFEVLQKEDYLDITLKSDFRSLRRNKNKDDYQPAVLSFTDADGKPVSWEIEIKPRGKMRRRVCSMPPLKLKFPKSEIESQELSKYHSLEMVEICNTGKEYEQYVLREYVAYKLYNMLSDFSFKVQLVKIDFQELEGKDTPTDGFGFIIENNDEMAERLGGKVLEPQSVGGKLPVTPGKELFSLFQFMIGNTDWWVTTAHNLEVFSKISPVVPIPIPYDFDYSGFVNTSYAVPNDRVPIKHVTERFYQGPCRTEAETQQTIQVFLDKKGAMMKYCQEFPHFTKYSRKHVIKYLNSFYKIIENRNRIKFTIEKNCDFWKD